MTALATRPLEQPSAEHDYDHHHEMPTSGGALPRVALSATEVDPR